jgi:hypothetical protein
MAGLVPAIYVFDLKDVDAGQVRAGRMRGG